MTIILSFWHGIVGHSDVIRHSGHCWECDGAHAFCLACKRHFNTQHPPIGNFII